MCDSKKQASLLSCILFHFFSPYFEAFPHSRMRAHVIKMHATSLTCIIPKCTSELEIFILVDEVLCDDAPNIRRSCGEVVISSRFNKTM